MIRGLLSNTIRRLGLLFTIDKLRYYVKKRQNRKANDLFRSKHPDFQIPPDYLMYESYQMNYQKYYKDGQDSARWIIEQAQKHISLEKANILDWGCGPARVIRHMPQLLHSSTKCFGTDYNKQSIDWCRANIKNVAFNHNGLAADLQYQSGIFDLVYGISIFTHLSEDMHFAWIAELRRILKPGGVIILSMQGNNFIPKLSQNEKSRFQRGELIVRGNVKEGHRTFSAFHPDAFLDRLWGKHFEVLDKIVISTEGKYYIPQDRWILRRK